MSSIDFRNAPAGRETDALVAELVLCEARPAPYPEDKPFGPIWDTKPSEQGAWYLASIYEEGDIPTWYPLPFTTRIEHAWKALQTFVPYVRLECNEKSDYAQDESQGAWHCDIWIQGGHACVNAPTAELAICRAALLAADMLRHPDRYPEAS